MSTVLKLADLGVVKPEVCVKKLLEQMQTGAIDAARIVMVVETDDGNMVKFASGARTDVVSCIGLLQMAIIQLAALTVDDDQKAV